MAAEIQVPDDLTSLTDADLDALASQIQQQAEAMRDDANTSDDALAALEALAANYQKVVDEMGAREEATQARAERVQAALSKIAGQADDAAAAADEVVADDTIADEQTAPAAVASTAGATELADSDGDEPDADAVAAEAEADLAEDDDETEAETADETVEATADEDSSTETEAADVAATDESTDTPDGETEGEELGITRDPAKSVLPSDPNAEQDPNEEAAVADENLSTEAEDAAADPVAALEAARSTTTSQTGSAPVPSSRRSLSTLVDSGVVNANHKGDATDRRKVAELICAKHQQLARMSSNVTYEPIILASAKVDFEGEETLGSGHEENFSVIERAKQTGMALVASGGNCAPLAPNYDVFNVAEPMAPVEGANPTVGAPRGGIRYITPPTWPEAQPGVRVTTEEEDAAGYTNQDPPGPTAPKPCVHLECSAIVECQVDAVSQCVTFGNLQYRTFPEQVEVFMEHLAVAFAQLKEITYLDAINAGSTAVTYTPAYGATRGTVFAFALAAHAYRKRNHMPIDAVLDVLAPDTLVPVLKADMVNDLHLGLNFVNADEIAVANELFARLNLNVTWYYDYSTAYGATNALQQAQVPGTLNGFPTLFQTFIYAPGTWIRLDGGTLDVGIVRDSTLNSQNDLQIFSEEWVQMCKVGVESVRLNLTLCPDGAGPAPTTALVCAS